MAIRNDPTRQRFPGVTGRLIVDTYRGRMRLRSWPKKRGPKATELQRLWRDWFTSANHRAKYAPGQQIDQSIKAARGTGLYPRDILIKAMGTGLFDAIDEDGNFITKRWDFWEPVMFQGVFSQLASNVSLPGGVLVTVQWPLPTLDTMSFWDAANPTRFTIPEHVEVVELTFTTMSTGSAGGAHVMYIRKNGTTLVARLEWSGSSFFSQSLKTVPLAVSPGDYFEAEAFSSNSMTLVAGDAAAFGLNVLQAQ